MIYAKINSGKVVNLIELDTYNEAEFTDCVSVKGLDVHIGDDFADGKFYRNGEELVLPAVQFESAFAALKEMRDKIKRDEAKIKALTEELATTNDVLQDLILTTLGGS